jgi:hypothetical protein
LAGRQRRKDMREMERAMAENRRKNHEVIMAAISTFSRLGYLIESTSVRSDGYLHIDCYPPQNEEGNNGEPKPNGGLSVDGISDVFKD